MGRENKYKTNVEPYLEQVKEWYGVLSEEQIAKRLGVSRNSFTAYKKKYPALKEALKQGREALIVELKESLKKKALGYTYKETKRYVKEVNGEKLKIVEEYERYAHPDTGAIHLLLKNLDKTWRNDDQTTVELKKQKLELEKEKAENNNW